MHVLLTRAKVASLPLSADLSLVTRRSGSFGSFARACTATRAEIEMLALWPAEALSRCLVELCSAFYWCGVICAVLVDSGLTMPKVTVSPSSQHSGECEVRRKWYICNRTMQWLFLKVVSEHKLHNWYLSQRCPWTRVTKVTSRRKSEFAGCHPTFFWPKVFWLHIP